jgi:hypothetical protein
LSGFGASKSLYGNPVFLNRYSKILRGKDSFLLPFAAVEMLAVCSPNRSASLLLLIPSSPVSLLYIRLRAIYNRSSIVNFLVVLTFFPEGKIYPAFLNMGSICLSLLLLMQHLLVFIRVNSETICFVNVFHCFKYKYFIRQAQDSIKGKNIRYL